MDFHTKHMCTVYCVGNHLRKMFACVDVYTCTDDSLQEAINESISLAFEMWERLLYGPPSWADGLRTSRSALIDRKHLSSTIWKSEFLSHISVAVDPEGACYGWRIRVHFSRHVPVGFLPSMIRKNGKERWLSLEIRHNLDEPPSTSTNERTKKEKIRK